MRDNRTDRQGKNYLMNKIFIKRKPLHCKVESVRKKWKRYGKTLQYRLIEIT